MADPIGAPSGTVTFLFTDVEGSTRLWEEHPGEMRVALERHDEILRSAIESRGGYVFSTAGDSFGAAFGRCADAIDSAMSIQQELAGVSWSTPGPVRVRVGLHSGEAHERGGDYFGSAVNRAARIMSAAYGGQVLCSEVTAALSGVAGLVDLGELGLRDLTAPVRLFRIDVPGVAVVSLAPRTLDAVPGNLPTQLTSFLGREELLAGVRSGLAVDRLVTLTGVGGVGKTRTAVQVAADLAPEFGHGVWLTELAPVRDSGEVPAAIASSLGVRPRSGFEPLEELVNELAGWEVLLVLDNAEHVITGAARTVEALLRGCLGVRVLVTSREGLAVPGERLMAVPPLGVAVGAEGAGSEAARLFEERASASSPGFVIDDENRGDVYRLCERLDGVPLAVELAAARVKMMTPAEIADRLEERFRLLTGGARTAVERHQTLRASVDWSFDLLSGDAQAVFSRLGVFVGSFGLDAAQALACGEDLDEFAVLDAVAMLVDQSLLTTVEGLGVIRYRMLETLRQYAVDRLVDVGDLDRFRRRHAEVFLDSGRQAGADFLSRAQVAVGAAVEADADNYRSAIAYAIEQDDLDTALGIAAALGDLHTYGTLAGELARQALRAPSANEHDLWPAVVSGPIYDDWMPAGERPSLETFIGPQRAALRPLTAKIIETYDPIYRGLVDQAVESAALWIREATDANSAYDIAYANAVLAHLQAMAGRDATQAVSASLEIADDLQVPGLLHFSHLVKGLSLENSEPEQAIEHFSLALELAEAVNGEIGVGIAAAHLAGVAGDTDTALTVIAALEPYISTEAAARPGAQRSFSLWVALAVALVPGGNPVAAARVLGFVDNLRGTLDWGSLDEIRNQTVDKLTNALTPDELDRHRTEGAQLSTTELTNELRQTLHELTRT